MFQEMYVHHVLLEKQMLVVVMMRSGDDTECDITYCAENEYVSSNVCTPCPAGKTNAAGDNASDMDTECDEQCSNSFICERYK